MNNSGNIGELIKSNQGEFVFCQYCKREIGCFEKNRLPKILRINQTMLQCFFDKIFPIKGDKYDQPEWFLYLWNHLENESIRIKNEHVERAGKK